MRSTATRSRARSTRTHPSADPGATLVVAGPRDELLRAAALVAALGLRAAVVPAAHAPDGHRARESNARTATARTATNGSAPTGAETWIVVDRARRMVTRAGAPVALTPAEFQLLAYLVEHRDRAVARDELRTALVAAIGSGRGSGRSRVVDALVARVRRKLELDPARPRHVRSVRGFGYRFDP